MAQQLSGDEIGRRQAACRELLGPQAPTELVAHCERVWRELSGRDAAAEPPTPEAVLAALSRPGLVPPRLLELAAAKIGPLAHEPVVGRMNADALAVSFAAAIYPQRVYQMYSRDDTLDQIEQGEAGQRLSAFLTVLRQPQPLVGALEAAGVLPDVPRDTHAAVFGDLTAADCVAAAGQPAEQVKTQRQQRLDGGALYLATLPPQSVRTVYEVWRTEASPVRFLRSKMQTPPFQLLELAPDGTTDTVFRQHFPTEPHETRQFVELLERLVRSAARAHERTAAEGRMADLVQTFWERMIARLVSGFPYYAFRCRFVWWWKQWARNHFRSLRPVGLLAGDVGDQGTASLGEDVELGPELLRWYREGYRLIRSTFFARTGAGPQGHEARRRIVDILWRDRFEHLVVDDLPPTAVRTIAEQFPDCSTSTMNVLHRRLRLRTWAYCLARIYKYTDWEVLSAKIPPALQRAGATSRPLLDEPAVLTVAALARCVPLSQTLLWALVARLALSAAVEPQKKQRFRLTTLVRELIYWLNEKTFVEAVRRGAEAGSRPDRAVLPILAAQTVPREALWTRRAIWAAVKPFVRGLNRHGTASGAQELFDLYSAVAVRADGCATCARAWRALPHQLVVPTWYLTAVEHLSSSTLLDRLRIESDRDDAVAHAVQTMVQCPACQEVTGTGGTGP